MVSAFSILAQFPTGKSADLLQITGPHRGFQCAPSGGRGGGTCGHGARFCGRRRCADWLSCARKKKLGRTEPMHYRPYLVGVAVGLLASIAIASAPAVATP